ncbi:MAG: hypothetical protein WAL59_28830, partial [Roseiarcus sp.]
GETSIAGLPGDAMITAEELSRLPLFAKLGPQEVVPDIHAAPGEYLVHEGDGRALWITVAARFEVTKMLDGVGRVIFKRIAGELFGGRFLRPSTRRIAISGRAPAGSPPNPLTSPFAASALRSCGFVANRMAAVIWEGPATRCRL